MRLLVLVVIVAVLGSLACGVEEPEASVPSPPLEHDAREPDAIPSPRPGLDLGPSPVTGAQTPVPEKSIRVATYNILAAKRGIEGIVETLDSIDADLIALQEVDRNTRRFGRVDQPRVLADALDLEAKFVRHRRYDRGEIGVALLSRFPIVEVERVAAPASRRAMLRAVVETPVGPVQVLVVHLVPTNPLDAPTRRARLDARRLEEAQHALKVATSEHMPTVVLGDFNARSDSPEYDAFTSALTDACPRVGGTWPTPVPVVRIDYVWTSPDLRTTSCLGPISSASDHRPVVAELVLSRSGEGSTQ